MKIDSKDRKEYMKAWRRENKGRYTGSPKDEYVISSIYTFKSEDDFGYYLNGNYKTGKPDNSNYIHIWLKCTDGKYRNLLEHRVKWEYFNGKIPKGMQIDHIIPVSNGGTNKLSNLRLVTPKCNMANEITKARHKETHQGKHVLQYDLDGNLIKEWNSVLECDGNGFCSRWVYDACNGRNWKSGHKYKGFNWYYK